MILTEIKIVGAIFIFAFIVIGFLYAKMIFIWRDVMLKQNERWQKEAERMEELKL